MITERYTHMDLGEEEKVTVLFESASVVTEGVECDVYSLPADPSRDLGVIAVQPGFRTPLQRVMGGDRTIERHISGAGTLLVLRADGVEEVHHVDDYLDDPFSTEVRIGDTMQWVATGETALRLVEICYPPYEPGRFEDI